MEKWDKWTPVSGLIGVLHNGCLIDRRSELFLEFNNRTRCQTVTFSFVKSVLAYRNADEGSLINTWSRISRNFNPDFRPNRSLYRAKSSQYIDWFLEESQGAYSIDDFTHYVFVTPDDVIDVISTKEPLVELIPINN